MAIYGTHGHTLLMAIHCRWSWRFTALMVIPYWSPYTVVDHGDLRYWWSYLIDRHILSVCSPGWVWLRSIYGTHDLTLLITIYTRCALLVGSDYELRRAVDWGTASRLDLTSVSVSYLENRSWMERPAWRGLIHKRHKPYFLSFQTGQRLRLRLVFSKLASWLHYLWSEAHKEPYVC